ncbi:MAG: endonuclease III domain-containing protein [Syntrophomonas sp.]|nr:endonuclease III domain-containing protein [Syntrophomonas sp.]
MKKLPAIYKTLLHIYGPQNWWPAQTPFEMMVGAILTQNTTWANVEKAINNFGKRLSPEFIASKDNDELAQIILPSGYYNQKALKLKALTQWYSKYDYDIKRARAQDSYLIRQELLAVKGIGYETADSILLYALNKPYFVVDTYTKRFLSRLGFNAPNKYEDLRLLIEANIPADINMYGEFHALIVRHAKCQCKKKPSCGVCSLESECKKLII